MRRPGKFWDLRVAVSVGLLAAFTLRAAAETPVTFERDVRPIFKARCFHCHGEEVELQGGLDLRLKRLMVSGGDSGPAIVEKNAAESPLIERLRSGEMPPEGEGKPLSKEQIDLIARWIDEGAATARPEPEAIGRGMLITEEDRNFWSFQPIADPVPPEVNSKDLVQSPIDKFVLARLEAAGLTFSAEADRRTLIRRASFDLTGLPPTPEDVEAFVADESSDAWEKLIERLLSSSAYGERWGRHWLDIAGYSDSEGMTEADVERKWSWKYRDYVINAFNADKPFDEFVREQLAGDELVNKPLKNLTAADIERLTATGFLRMAADGTADGSLDQGVSRNQVITDTIQIVSNSLLGLTLNCAQCHEHRYDPIPQSDYYSFRAIFEPALDWKNWRAPNNRLVSLYTDEDRARAAELEKQAKAILDERTKKQNEHIERVFQLQLEKIPEEERDAIVAARDTDAKKRTPEQQALLKKYPSTNVTAGSLYLYDRKASDELKKMSEEAEKIRKQKPVEEFVRVLTEVPGKVPETFLFHRGDHEQLGEKLQPAALTILAKDAESRVISANDPARETTGRRLAYANYLTSGEHPLLTRVMVNRIWRHHFGRGIVETPSEFGQLGTRPTHPQLLDWLAREFVRGGWSIKSLHRMIMTSATYRQGPRTDTLAKEQDPDNRLFGGARMQRLDAETLRDSVLAVSGRLNRKAFGPPVPVMADLVGQWVIGKENLNAGRPGAVIDMRGEEFRRSIYVQSRRTRPLAVLETFDRPAMSPNCNARTVSTVAPQSLMLMNGTFLLAQADALAARVRTEAGDDTVKQIERAWQLAFTREPSEAELEGAVAFLDEQRGELKERAGKNDKPDLQALANFCQVLLSSNEFLYID